ncbi:hypothetical protein PINS_up018467 [Pythium insidiosum]|nr:hypothetical protein PINS_up018467 [Pythium insidiosum]
MLHFSVPYARASLQSTLRNAPGSSSTMPTKFCSAETAERMAIAAWHHAQQILLDGDEEGSKTKSLSAASDRFRSAIGVGCTAALSTSYDRRGENHGFISICRVVADEHEGPADDSQIVQSFRRHCATYHVKLDKTSGRTRQDEDRVMSEHLVYFLGKSTGVDPDGVQALGETLLYQRSPHDDVQLVLPTLTDDPSFEDTSPYDALEQLCRGRVTNPASVLFMPGTCGQIPVNATVAMPFQAIVLPGSFNPLHKGHVELAQAAQRVMKSKTGVEWPVVFEIAVANADKGSIAADVVRARVDQFVNSATAAHGLWSVAVTNSTLFSQKASLMKNCIFVIGADTAVRLVDKKYYDMDEHKMILVLDQIARDGCSFIVAGRFDDKVTQRFISAEEVVAESIPKIFRHLFVPLDEATFRNDLSSTQLRKKLLETGHEPLKS